MRYWLGGLIVSLIAMLQASSVQQFSVLGVAPNLMLVLLVVWVVVRGLDDALPMIAIAGIALGLLGLETPGLVLLALLPIAMLGVLREVHVIHNEGLLAVALVLASTIAYELVMLASVLLTGGHDVQAGIQEVVLPAALVNVALTPPVYILFRFARQRSGPRLTYAR